MTYVNAYGQPYGRYVVNETLPVVAYDFQPVKEKIYVPKTVTKNKTTVQVQYVPVYSYQPRLRNVYSSNPFMAPQQVWENVPVVQYQTNYVQVNQPFTYQEYEEQEVTKMIPVLVSQPRQLQRTVDRPLATGPNGGNMIANNSPLLNSPANNNIYQQSALVAQANRNTPNYPTRPIDYPAYNRAGAGYFAQAPQPYYVATNPVPPSNPVVAANTNMPPQNQMLAANAANNTLVYPAVPLRPVTPYNTNPGYPPVPGGYPNQTYNNMAARPVFSWPAIASSTGSLFNTSLFSSNRNTNYVASNTQVSQPYLWSGSNSMNGGTTYNSAAYNNGFRPNSNPYAAPAPQPAWGVSPGTNSRDPMQGGMPPTVLR